MSTRDASKGIPSNLLAFPSLSSSLHTLPQATNLNNVALHPNMYGKLASEAKLQKALSKTAQNPPPPAGYPSRTATPSHCDSSHLMMRKPQKSK